MTQFFPPDFAATGQLIEELARQLASQNVDVNVFTGQPGYAFAKGEAPKVEESGNVWVKRTRMSQLFPSRIRGKAVNGLMYAMRAVLHLMRRDRHYQVLLVTTAPPFLPIIGYLANVFLGAKYVCLLYDLYPDIAVELDVVKQKHPIARLWQSLNRRVWRRSSGIIVLSDSMKGRIAEHCPEIEKKISVIHSWSDAEQIMPLEKENNWFAQEHGLVDRFVVLYSGNMGRCHDVDTLFEAAQLLRDEPIVFVCIGGGAKREALMEKVEASGLTNFSFLPYQEKSVLPYSLTASDLSLVTVAKGMESLVAPSKLYPALATGRPIVSICPAGSYLGDLLAAAGSGAAFRNGEAHQLADFILELAKNREKASRMGDSGRQYLERHFTPDIIARQYLSVIKSVRV
ncbi:MAG: glycosyltransferase family 4 protein [Cyanobacteria bacterium P01_F01_bin.53]